MGLRFLAATSCVLFWLVGCGSNPPPQTSDGANVLTGMDAFPVHFVAIDTTSPKAQCNLATSLSGGGYASFILDLTDVDASADAGPVPIPPAGAHVLRIELAGPSYANGERGDGGAGAPVTPGMYTVGFEGEDDDDLCMLPPGSSAIVDLFDFSADGSFTQSTAASGMVTITSIATGDIEGTFQVSLSQSPFRVTQPTIPLAGTFHAPAP